MPKLIYTTETLTQYVNDVIANRPMQLYRDEVVCNDRRTISKARKNGYMTAERKRADRKPFCKIIAEQVLLHQDKFGYLGIPDGCRYRIGKHATEIAQNKKTLTTGEAIERYINNSSRREERTMHCLCAQGEVGKFQAIDYQVPTRNSGHDKIDLVLKDNDGNYYITEAKKFQSDESFLRCVLEIQSYYINLTDQFLQNNEWELNQVKKAVLFDETSFAFAQVNETWAKDLAAAFDIHVFILSHDENWKFHIEELH